MNNFWKAMRLLLDITIRIMGIVYMMMGFHSHSTYDMSVAILCWQLSHTNEPTEKTKDGKDVD